MVEIAKELREACSGHPHANIAWPHRLLHEAADALDAAHKRIAALEAALEPFARRAFEFEAADDEWFCGPPIQVKHLRAARDLLPSRSLLNKEEENG